jgi:hypothetical protein
MLNGRTHRASVLAIGTAGLALLLIAPSRTVTAQASLTDLARIETGTEITVRTTETIDVRSLDGRIYSGIVDQDVLESSTGRVAIPAGSAVELEARDARDGGDLVLDLDSVTVDGRRYGVRAAAERMDSPQGGIDKQKAAEYIGGGALLGTIIGAVTGGGKGAAIGAAAGAAAGAGAVYVTRGRNIRVPGDAVVTFRLDHPLDVDVPDDGYMRDRNHYHRY